MRFNHETWNCKKLIDLVSIHARIGWQGLRQSEFLNSGEIYLITGTDFDDGLINFNECKFINSARYEQDKNIQIDNNDILITKDGSIGKIAYINFLDKKATLNAGIYRVRVKKDEILSRYLFHYLNGNRLMDFASKQMTGGTIKHLNQSSIINMPISYPSLKTQAKLYKFFDLIECRIKSQSKIIEDLELLKKWFINQQFEQNPNAIIGQFIKQTFERNKNNGVTRVLSVSNKYGFINQNEQFEDREVASNDKTNYKIVRQNDFAFNPARINVGSISKLNNYDTGIVSPMYICFRCNSNDIIADYLDFYFLSSSFKKALNNRLEGSVRQCLQYDALCSIKFLVPSLEEQIMFVNKIKLISEKLQKEKDILELYKKQKAYLLQNMFI